MNTSNNLVNDNQNQRWYNSNNKLHREDGPAIIYSNGYRGWYINGKKYSENHSFQKVIGITDDQMAAIVAKFGDVK